MDDQWFRNALVEAHKHQREHLYWLIEGIDEEHMLRNVTDEEFTSSIIKILQHIGNAETYWFHKNGNEIGPPIKDLDSKIVLERLKENTKKIENKVMNCDPAELKIQTGMNKQTPSIAWCVLRTYQHGLYHAGQIAKLRRIEGAEELAYHRDELWSLSVDSVIEIINRFANESH